MAQTPNLLHAAPFQFAATATVQVSDSFSLRTVTFAAQWYRTFLGDPAAAGTSTSPVEFLRYFQNLLNAAPGATYWTVALTSAGLVRIAYPGGTGAASLSFISTVPRNQLGFTSDLTFAAPGASNTAAYLPTHCLFAVATGAEDTDYSPEFPGFAASVTVGGVVDVLSDGVALAPRRMKLLNVPRTWTDRTALSLASTPSLPEDISVTRLVSVGGAVAAGMAPPWSIHQHLYAAAGQLCAFTDALQAAVTTPSGSLYDVGYVHPETYASVQQQRPAAPGLRALVTRNDFATTLTNREQIP